MDRGAWWATVQGSQRVGNNGATNTHTLRGHCRVINCPNFNTPESQGIGRPEEKERERERLAGGAVRTHTFY